MKKKTKKDTMKEHYSTKIKLYSIRGELIGALKPGGKIDFQALLRKKNTKRDRKVVI